MEFFGFQIDVSETVYPPSEDSELAFRTFLKCMKMIKNKDIKILDMGTGSGVLGLLAASQDNVSDVVFADVNNEAITMAMHNFDVNREKIKSKCSFVNSDLFSNIEGFFDIILFNAPYLISSKEDGNLHTAISGGLSGVELTIKFLTQSLQHLNYGSYAIIIASSLSDLNNLKRTILSMPFLLLDERKLHFFFEDIVALLLVRS
jgi:release factor glutamine methyltransferase